MGKQKGFIDTTKSPGFMPITVEEARSIRNEHKSRTFHTKLKLSDNRKIRGFSFSRDELELALYGKQLSNSDLANIGCEVNSGIYLAFGYHKEETSLHHEGATIVLYGVNSNNRLIEIDDRIFDYSKPCPDNCPEEDQDTERGKN